MNTAIIFKDKIISNRIKRKKENQYILRILFLILLINNSLNAQFAQERPHSLFKLGGGVESFISGNGLGTFFSPYLTIGDGINFLSCGPVIQKRSLLMQGAKIGYSRVLTGSPFNSLNSELEKQNGNLQLNFFCYAQYINQLPLSYVALRTEELMNSKNDLGINRDWNKVKLTTAELCAGFELRIKITRNISWKNYIGASYYQHLNYLQGMYHEKSAIVLAIGTGIGIKHF